jgi:nitrate reductase delta subunit
MKSFKALSALLCYPTPELVESVSDIRAVLREERLLPPVTLGKLEPLLEQLASVNIYELEETYVQLFDRSRALALNLFEHVHGESRDRGQAMVDLKALYESHGLQFGSSELPDFLPLFLEFLSILSLDEARLHLADAAHIVRELSERLDQRESPYAALLGAIAELAGDTAADVQLVQDDGVKPDDLAALDASWEEAAVTFGPGEALDNCSRDRLAIRMRAARRTPSAPA